MKAINWAVRVMHELRNLVVSSGGCLNFRKEAEGSLRKRGILESPDSSSTLR